MFRYYIDERLSLTLLAPHHERIIFELQQASHDIIKQYQPMFMRITTLAALRDQLQTDFELLGLGKGYTWVIAEDDTLIGLARLTLSGLALNVGELQFWLVHTNLASAKRILQSIGDFAMLELGVYRLVIQTSPETLVAQVATRCGFEREADLRHALRWHGVGYDLSIYSVLTIDWSAHIHPIFAFPLNDSITLRLQEMRHVFDQYELVRRNLPHLQPWFDWLDDEYTLDDEQLYTWLRLRAYGRGQGLLVSIWYHQQVIGSISLTINTAQRYGELGYWLDSAYYGKGIATQSVKAVLDYSFDVLKLNRIWLRAAEDNKPSRQLAERVGMVEEAILRRDEYIAGRWVNHVVYGILAADWLIQKIKEHQ